jgi:2-oxoglutarate ferredoxin oxidoreductase subunit beta
LTKKEIAADHPTWCPGWRDSSVLCVVFQDDERRKFWQEKIMTDFRDRLLEPLSVFVQAYGATTSMVARFHLRPGYPCPRPDLHVFVFGGDGDLFSIGGNHVTHTARKNIKLTCASPWTIGYYGLTKKQTSPTSPVGFKSKTDIWGAVDYPVNP